MSGNCHVYHVPSSVPTYYAAVHLAIHSPEVLNSLGLKYQTKKIHVWNYFQNLFLYLLYGLNMLSRSLNTVKNRKCATPILTLTFTFRAENWYTGERSSQFLFFYTFVLWPLFSC